MIGETMIGETMKELTLLTTGFVFGFLACAATTVIVFHDQFEALRQLQKHRKYMEK